MPRETRWHLRVPIILAHSPPPKALVIDITFSLLADTLIQSNLQ